MRRKLPVQTSAHPPLIPIRLPSLLQEMFSLTVTIQFSCMLAQQPDATGNRKLTGQSEGHQQCLMDHSPLLLQPNFTICQSLSTLLAKQMQTDLIISPNINFRYYWWHFSLRASKPRELPNIACVVDAALTVSCWQVAELMDQASTQPAYFQLSETCLISILELFLGFTTATLYRS